MSQRPPTGKGAPEQSRVQSGTASKDASPQHKRSSERPRQQSDAPSDRKPSGKSADKHSAGKHSHDSDRTRATREQDAFADSDIGAEPDVVTEIEISAEDRARIYALDYDAVLAALDAEDDITIALVSECISACSEQVGVLLKEGKDFLAALTPTAATPAVQVIAMEIVQEAVEEEMEGAE